jgi:hypothetical protein
LDRQDGDWIYGVQRRSQRRSGLHACDESATVMSIVTPTASDDDVFRAFALGDALDGDTTRSMVAWSETSDDTWVHVQALFSHDVLLALRSEECVVFDASPCKDGSRCVCRYVSDASKACAAVEEHYGAAEVEAMDHGAFVALAGRLGAL